MVKTTKDFEDAAKSLLKQLSGRSREVVERRFGIGTKTKKQTLEAIGKPYKITRERVRQIEAAALNKIRSNALSSRASILFDILKREIDQRGHMWREEHLLSEFTNEAKKQNYIQFFLALGESFQRIGGDAAFYHHWITDREETNEAHKALGSFLNKLGDELLSKNEIADQFRHHTESVLNRTLEQDAIFAWLGISKMIDSNQFGEWGLSTSPLIRPRGMRDYAYLVLKKHGSPLHFREVAHSIEQSTGRKTHVQTVHNELIKDDRFILVGRGLYALAGWGYQPGIVRDVIQSLLKNHGPLSREELVKKVQKERHVKENTILINLQNKSFFKKLPDGRFDVA